jgi:hypothetical protein
VASPVGAQQAPLSADDFIATLDALSAATMPSRNVTMQGVGTGTVAPGGALFASVSGTTSKITDGGNGDADGSLSFGAGFGDAETSFGLQVSANITSVNPVGDSGFLGLKIGTRVPAAVPVYVALSVSGAGWGDSEDNPVRTTLAATTYANYGGYPIMYTAGIGSHLRDGEDPGAFAGIGIGLTENIGASAAYNGNNFNLGVGVRIPRIPGASLSLTANDVFDEDDARGFTGAISIFATDVFGKGW